jgi:hypothetical protein
MVLSGSSKVQRRRKDVPKEPRPGPSAALRQRRGTKRPDRRPPRPPGAPRKTQAQQPGPAVAPGAWPPGPPPTNAWHGGTLVGPMTQAKLARVVAAPNHRATAVPVGTRSVTALGGANEGTNQPGLGNSAPLCCAVVLSLNGVDGSVEKTGQQRPRGGHPGPRGVHVGSTHGSIFRGPTKGLAASGVGAKTAQGSTKGSKVSEGVKTPVAVGGPIGPNGTLANL